MEHYIPCIPNITYFKITYLRFLIDYYFIKIVRIFMNIRKKFLVRNL